MFSALLSADVMLTPPDRVSLSTRNMETTLRLYDYLTSLF